MAITSIQNNHEPALIARFHWNSRPSARPTFPSPLGFPKLAHRITMLRQNGAVRLGCYVEMGEEIIVPWLWIQLGDFFQDHPGKWLVGWVNMANQPETLQKILIS